MSIKFVVYWEARKKAYIYAENEVEARELFESGEGELLDVEEKEITMEPEFFPIKE